MGDSHPGIYFVLFAAGLIIGSFLNVCIYRIPKKLSLLWPHSFCPNCSIPVKWYDNIPLISYIFLKGRCRVCKSKISIRYFVVELLTGFIFLFLYWYFVQYREEFFCVFLVYTILCCALIIATFVDLELRIIPNEVTLIGIPLFLVFSVLCPALHNAQGTLRNFSLLGISRLDSFISSVLGLIIGSGLIYMCAVLGKWVFKKDAMGFGDVKLMGMIGTVAGWKLVASNFFVAPFFGLLMAIPVMIFKKSNVIPYCPFLSIAALLCIIFQDYFISLVNTYVIIFSFMFGS